jgi:hypothetical protein
MPGVYVALPPIDVTPVKPPGWKSNWEFPGPDPPGYESIYIMEFINPPTQVNGGDTATFTARIATYGSDDNLYITGAPSNAATTWTQI